MTLAGVVKEDLACSGSSLPEKRKIQPEVEVTSYKRQAPSDTTCGCVDNFNKDLTCRIMHDTV